MADNKPMRLIPVVVKQGEPPVLIEVSDDPPEVKSAGGAWVTVATGDEEAVPKTMDQALDRVRPLVEVLFEKLATVSKAPKEVELTLGLKLSGKVGIFVAESSGEATIGVKLKWSA